MLHDGAARAKRYAKTSCAREFSAEREFNTTIVFFLGQEILTNVHKLNVTFFFSNLFLLQLYVDIYLCMKTVISMYHL
jgi:hypothetical protein